MEGGKRSTSDITDSGERIARISPSDTPDSTPRCIGPSQSTIQRSPGSQAPSEGCDTFVGDTIGRCLVNLSREQIDRILDDKEARLGTQGTGAERWQVMFISPVKDDKGKYPAIVSNNPCHGLDVTRSLHGMSDLPIVGDSTVHHSVSRKLQTDYSSESSGNGLSPAHVVPPNDNIHSMKTPVGLELSKHSTENSLHQQANSHPHNQAQADGSEHLDMLKTLSTSADPTHSYKNKEEPKFETGLNTTDSDRDAPTTKHSDTEVERTMEMIARQGSWKTGGTLIISDQNFLLQLFKARLAMLKQNACSILVRRLIEYPMSDRRRMYGFDKLDSHGVIYTHHKRPDFWPHTEVRYLDTARLIKSERLSLLAHLLLLPMKQPDEWQAIRGGKYGVTFNSFGEYLDKVCKEPSIHLYDKNENRMNPNFRWDRHPARLETVEELFRIAKEVEKFMEGELSATHEIRYHAVPEGLLHDPDRGEQRIDSPDQNSGDHSYSSTTEFEGVDASEGMDHGTSKKRARDEIVSGLPPSLYPTAAATQREVVTSSYSICPDHSWNVPDQGSILKSTDKPITSTTDPISANSPVSRTDGAGSLGVESQNLSQAVWPLESPAIDPSHLSVIQQPTVARMAQPPSLDIAPPSQPLSVQSGNTSHQMPLCPNMAPLDHGSMNIINGMQMPHHIAPQPRNVPLAFDTPTQAARHYGRPLSADQPEGISILYDNRGIAVDNGPSPHLRWTRATYNAAMDTTPWFSSPSPQVGLQVSKVPQDPPRFNPSAAVSHVGFEASKAPPNFQYESVSEQSQAIEASRKRQLISFERSAQPQQSYSDDGVVSGVAGGPYQVQTYSCDDGSSGQTFLSEAWYAFMDSHPCNTSNSHRQSQSPSQVCEQPMSMNTTWANGAPRGQFRHR